MRVAVVVNPASVRRGERFRAIIDGELSARGLPAARYLLTTPEDPGTGQARAALEAGVDRVLVAGGDGTVRMVLAALRRTDVPVGLLPSGTGNLLARNLRLPLRLRPALVKALDGTPRPFDLLRYTNLDTDAQGYAAVMAGLGADAAVVTDATARLKRLGQLGYVLAGLRHVKARPVPSRIAVDGEVLLRDASLVQVGNLGELRAGVRLLPHADASDGLLNLLVASPRHSRDVLRMMAGVLLRTRREPFVDRRVARDVVVNCDLPVPFQVDGDVIGAVSAIRFEVLPGVARVVSA
ncbi:NAD(+)/NADH kinase [Tessaracoccus sp. MC1865]|uniref:diacylglycerol/lipid kinase family protein n=1 Tax=Tessaracoccus sp. MC1865 TaxID=2760310 RepID=UPI001600A9BE|nr:diacylglycerol kinase family protein [Tessaracoccus sp. MC1865]MBB1482833.1 NAD(+)/NADH kinase [Tessaracoccus sp. MC1865]QTO37728.1 NAD(+)/NADH kinase [Tessaracoccus sp. MC1865]